MVMLHLSRSQPDIATDNDVADTEMEMDNDLDDPIVDSKISADSHDGDEDHKLSKREMTELEKKDASRMVEVSVISMLAMNVCFLLYCIAAEKVRAKKKSKYHAVSADEFHFDTVDVNKNDKDQLEDIDYGLDVKSNIDM